MEFLVVDWLGKPVWMWLTFFGIVITLLALDLGVLHRKQREIGVRESLLLSSAISRWPWPLAAGCGGNSARPPG